jgi:hypothetical protein
VKCCNDDCNQGRDCPVRTQRLKAGGPPPTDYPWQEAHPDDRMPLSDNKSAAIVLGIIVLIWVLVALLVGVM